MIKANQIIFRMKQIKKLNKCCSIFLFFFTTLGYSQVGIGTNKPESSSILELKSKTKGILFPRLTEVQRDDIAAPVIGLTVYCKDCDTKGVHSYDGANWIPLNGIISSDGLKYETVVSLTTGRVWLDRNLGATQVATDLFDEEALGYLYQYGRRSDGHQLRSAETTTGPIANSAEAEDSLFIYGNGNGDPAHSADDSWTDYEGEENLWQGVNGVNNPCPSGFRLPTADEFTDEIEGMEIPRNADKMFESVLKLPSVGYRREDNGNTMTPTNSLASFASLYQTSTPTNSIVNVRLLRFFQDSLEMSNSGNYEEASLIHWIRIVGAAVRCTKD
jgi:hypothetical protein